MSRSRVPVLSIAGFDPSGGAGLLADIKTFERNKVLGMGVCTALTFQNDREFDAVNWTPVEDILRQIDVLHRQFRFSFVKIGLIESVDVLSKVVAYLAKQPYSVKIILDPIFRASAGFDFHGRIQQEAFLEIVHQIYMLTPNWEEMQQLFPDKPVLEGAAHLSQFCHIYLKGGHNQKDPGKDYVYYKQKIYPLNPKTKRPAAKHGSGCVLSAALTANLANQYPMVKACVKAKRYISKYLDSSPTLLGYHQ